MNPIVGRNDPCPCGSGRKYKKCCLLKDQKQAQQLRSLDTHSQWVSFHWQLVKDNISELVRDQVELVSERWGSELARPTFQPFLEEHALLDVGQNQIVLASILQGDSGIPNERKASFGETLSHSHLACYEVTACRRGEYLKVIDRISGSEHTIVDESLSKQLEPMEAFVGRLITHEETTLVLPGWNKLEFWKRKRVFKHIRSAFDEMGANLEDAEEMNVLLKRQPERILGAIAEFDALQAPSGTAR